jgi:putative phage-type endonuclease
MTLTPQHQKIRANRITGSRAAAILGMSKFAGPIDVYRELVENKKTETSGPDVDRGNHLESGLRSWYADITGLVVHKSTPRVHPKHTMIAAAADGLAGPTANAWDRVLEIKSPRRGDDWGDSGSQDFPEYYLPQVALEMSCYDLNRCDLAALVYGELRVYPVARNLDLEMHILKACEAFWTNHVVARVPPPVDGTASYANHLAEVFPISTERQLLADNEAEHWAGVLINARKGIEDAEQVEEMAKNKLKALMCDASTMIGNGWSASWKNVSARKTVDWRAYAASLGGTEKDAEQFCKQGTAGRRFLLTTKKG